MNNEDAQLVIGDLHTSTESVVDVGVVDRLIQAMINQR